MHFGTPSRTGERLGWSCRALLLVALTLVGCEPSREVGPREDFVGVRVERLVATRDPSTTEQVLVNLYGTFDPAVCARISDSSVLSRGDTLYVGLLARRANDCRDAGSTFRHAFSVASQPPRTLTIHARGAGGPSLTFSLPLPLVP